MLDIVVQTLHVHHEPARVSSPCWRACPPSGLLVIYSRCLSTVFLMRKVIRAGVTGVASGESSQRCPVASRLWGTPAVSARWLGKHVTPSRLAGAGSYRHRSPMMASYPTWSSWRGSEGRWQVAPGERVQEAAQFRCPAPVPLSRNAHRREEAKCICRE